MVNFKVRTATTADLPRLVELWQAQQTLNTQLDPRLTLLSSSGAAWRDQLARVLADEAAMSTVFVARREGGTVGFIYVSISPASSPQASPTGIIHDLVVDAHQGSGGVGTVVLDAAFEWLRVAGVRDVIVERLPHHNAVQGAFWRSKGASIIQATRYLSVPTDEQENR